MRIPIVIDPAVLQVEGIQDLEDWLAEIKSKNAQIRTPRELVKA